MCGLETPRSPPLYLALASTFLYLFFVLTLARELRTLLFGPLHWELHYFHSFEPLEIRSLTSLRQTC